MNRTHTAGLTFFAVVVVLIGLMGTGGDLFGKALTTALLPSKAAEIETSEEQSVVETSEQATENEATVEAGSDAAPVLSDEVVRRVINNPQRVKPLPVEQIDTETLWLARVIYSETKQPEEMELVAWVVRNRVETRYRGRDSYRSAVLDPYQFSAFNPGDRKRQHYSNLTHRSNAPGFDRALSIAHTVKNAGEHFRPFSQTTRHFYSERSMVGVRHPAWAKDGVKVDPKRSFTLDERRFRFFADVR
jgi:spore germination cell wall hydrolase CwlJ-like protein